MTPELMLACVNLGASFIVFLRWRAKQKTAEAERQIAHYRQRRTYDLMRRLVRWNQTGQDHAQLQAILIEATQRSNDMWEEEGNPPGLRGTKVLSGRNDRP